MEISIKTSTNEKSHDNTMYHVAVYISTGES